MQQMSFVDAEYAGKRKQTRRERFLIEMDQVVPWKGLIALIGPHYPKGEGGRPAYLLMAMLRVHLMMLRQGTVVDATIIHALSSTKNKDGKRDPEMHQTKKGCMYFFGMKAHIGVDAESGLVHSLVGTAANVADVTQVDQLLRGEETYVSGDAGYTDMGKCPEHQKRKMIWSIAARPRTHKKHGKKSVIAQVRRKIEYAKAHVPGDQASVWLYESALSRPDEKHWATGHAICLVEPVNDAKTAAGCGRSASVRREMRREKALFTQA